MASPVTYPAVVKKYQKHQKTPLAASFMYVREFLLDAAGKVANVGALDDTRQGHSLGGIDSNMLIRLCGRTPMTRTTSSSLHVCFMTPRPVHT